MITYTFEVSPIVFWELLLRHICNGWTFLILVTSGILIVCSVLLLLLWEYVFLYLGRTLVIISRDICFEQWSPGNIIHAGDVQCCLQRIIALQKCTNIISSFMLFVSLKHGYLMVYANQICSQLTTKCIANIGTRNHWSQLRWWRTNCCWGIFFDAPPFRSWNIFRLCMDKNQSKWWLQLPSWKLLLSTPVWSGYLRWASRDT